MSRGAESGAATARPLRRLLPVSLGVFLACPAAADEGASKHRVERDADIAVAQPAPHEGGGETTAYPFFADEPGMEFVFRKRALHPGAAIGYHRHEGDEIYYVLEGRGELTMNGEPRVVEAGTAILTREGDSHGLRTLGDADLVILIVYAKAGD